MLIESRYIVSSLFISTVILFLGWIATLVGKSEAFEKHVNWWRQQRLLKRAAVVAVLIGVVAYAGTKPDPSGGDDTGGSSTNDVTQVEGDASNTNDVGWIGGDADGTNDVGGALMLGMFRGAPTQGETGGEGDDTEPEVPTNAPISHLSRITHSMCAAGFTIQGLGTNETFDFSAPEGAFVATNWILHGAANARIHTDLKDWTFPFGNDFVTNLAAFASGKVMTDTANPDQFFAPFAASLGVPPEAKWGELDETNRPSIYWQAMTENNAFICTWQNVLLDRAPTNPVSFQVEFRPGGSFIYRYDLSRLPSEECLSNVVIGVKNGDGEWFAPTVGRSLTSLKFARVTLGDLINPDRDGDGVPTEVELFDLGTDPDLADSDFDGKSDGEEFAAGTNPNSRDSDGDGLVDGIDPDPTTSDAFVDEDEDGIDDNLERRYFGDTSVIDDPSEIKEDGFSLETEILAGINPTNAAPVAVTYITNSLVSWKLFDAFAVDTSTTLHSSLLTLNSAIWQRSFRINKTSPWQQYFVSAAPDSAVGWMLEGMRLEWEDSNGNGGSVARSPSGDSWRIPLSTNETANITLRLRATSAFVRTATPLYLIAYTPEFKVNGGSEIDYQGVKYSIFTDGSDSQVGLDIDRSHRPCHAPLSEEERDMSVLDEMQSSGDLSYDGDENGGSLFAYRPGVYPFPELPATLATPPTRRLLRGSGNGDGNHVLLILSPSVWYGEDHCYSGIDLGYDWSSDSYYYEETYPLNSKCLWGNWSRDVFGGWVCNCTPGVATGFGDYWPLVCEWEISSEDKCLGTIKIGDDVIWSGEALHLRDYSGCVGTYTHSELLSQLDECQTCEDTCTGGVCKYGDEGTSLSSLAFKVCVGAPRKGQVSGFAWFKTDGPITVMPSTFLYKFRNDADVSVTTNYNYRHVVCNDPRGRDLVIERVSGVTRITVRDAVSQTLDHTWEFSNENGSASRVRVRKISKLDNPLEDWTYIYEDGNWTRFDNLKRVFEVLQKEDGLNDPWDGVKRELRTVYDAATNELSSTYTESRRIGECENAVLRETYRSEWTGLNNRVREADYWYDPEHRARHGQLRLLTGNDRPWEYHDFDEFGREVLRVEQRNGSNVPGSFPWSDGEGGISSYSGLADAFVTVFDYTPMDGDDANANDDSRVRRETKYVVTAGAATVIGRTWWRYTRGFSGYETVRAEKWRAGSSAGLASPSAAGNAYSYEETFTDDGEATPLVLRNQIAEALDENGVLTRNDYDISRYVVTCTSRKYFVGAATNNQQPTTNNQLPTYTQTDFDPVYGLVLRTATCLAAGGIVLSEERSTYDEKNRLRSTTYSDGTSLTNAYSCCRLLWSRDREGRKTLRSAVTGYDQIYNADEEVWLADISTNGGYRVVQHFFDGLGRETNTLVYVGHTPGEANDFAASNGKAVTVATTEYPNGGSDLAIRTDERGVVTMTRSDILDNLVENGEEVQTNGIRVTSTKTRSVLGGGSSTRREWGEHDWTEESRFSDYSADGCRIDFTVTSSPDCGMVTNLVTTYDFLGRAVSQIVPGANGSRIETRSFYDGVSDRLLRTETDGSPDVTYGYNERGERISSEQSGIVNRSEKSYETISGEVWQVRTVTRLTGSEVNSVATEKVQLTGLSDVLRSRSVSVAASGKVTRTESSFDPTNNIVIGEKSVDVAMPEITRSHFGLLVSSSGIDGTEAHEYDAFGREASVSSFATGSDVPRSRQIFTYDISGNVVETVSDYGTDGRAATVSSFDMLGREVSRTDPLGSTITTEYDGLGRAVSVGGDTYPLQTGYDSTGRKTSGLTTRDNGANWDSTTWTYDPASGLNTAKRYADGSLIAYAYTDNGKKTRTTWARGVWKESAYDSDNRVSSVTYSDGTPTVEYAYSPAGKLTEAATAGGSQYLYGYDSRLLCTNEIFGIGSESFDVVRSYDERDRCDSFAVIVTNVAHAVKTRQFDAEGRVAGYTFTNGVGRSVSVSLQYDGTRLVHTVFTLPNGSAFSAILTRNAARPNLITRRSYRFDGNSIYWYESDYDLMGRPTNANDSVSLARAYLYNRRNELAEALVGTNAFAFAYDSIGNRTTDSVNDASRTYAANNLNQYTQVDASQLTYDTDGNLTQDDRFAYTYDAENRLLSVRPISPMEGALAVVNAYDHKHRRVTKRVERFDGEAWQTVETHTFVYDGGNIVLEKIASPDGTSRTVEYFWGNDLSGSEQGAGGVGGLLAVSIDGSFYFPCYDQNGNVVCYVSESGTIAAQYVYDPYGNVIDEYGNMPDQFAFGFSTKYLDRETGLVGYQRRFYRPDYGRWLNRDPIEEEGGENLYAFCGNNALWLYDVNGLVDWQSVVNGGLQTIGGILTMKLAAASIVGTGTLSTPVAAFFMAWAAASIATGLETLAAGLRDKGSPEALQVTAAITAYETAVGQPMPNWGTNFTYCCYYVIDIKCLCYSVNVNWTTMIQKGILYRKYAEIPLFTRSGIQMLKTNSSLEFIGTVPGSIGAAGSMFIDYKSMFSDVYEMSDQYFNGNE